MKTFVSDLYQVTPMDNGGVKVIIYAEGWIYITYNPDNKKPWSKHMCRLFNNYTDESKTITDLGLCPYELKILYKALKAVNKQDLMDNEILFVK